MVIHTENDSVQYGGYVSENWSNLTDKEMSRHLKISVRRVRSIRLKLNLRREHEKNLVIKKPGILDPEEVKYLLTEGGKTLEDVNVLFPTMSLVQVFSWCRKHGFSNAPSQRKLSWYAVRYGNPKLADEDFISRTLQEFGSDKKKLMDIFKIKDSSELRDFLTVYEINKTTDPK